MDRPQRKTTTAYHWSDIEKYVESKHGIRFRGYKREIDGQYRDFWHWIVKMCHPIGNGCFITLPRDYGNNYEGNADWWQPEIMTLILGEFPELADEKVWVEW